MSELEHDPNFLPVHRSEALSDGIFAVAMTLLVIELKVPNLEALHGFDELAQALLDLIPKVLAWLISFFVLAIFWVGHHRVFARVRRTDGTLVWLNVTQLAFVSLMPFSCALIGEKGSVVLAQIVYSFNMAMLAILALLIARHIQRHPELTPTPMPMPTYRAARFRIVGVIIISGVAVLIAWFVRSPAIGCVAFMLMMPIGRISRAMEQRELRAEAGAALPGAA